MPRAAWSCCLLVLIACHATPSTAVRHADYAAARARFHTVLTKHGPAPGKWAPYTMPDDAHAVAYAASGLQLQAWVSRAGDDRRHPAVLFLHGGGSFDARDWQMSQPFRDAGFVVMTPLLRGEAGQPGDYSMFYDEVDDALAAADVLARQPDVDPQRLYLAGHSAGGSLALLTALASHRFRAVASLSGSPDFAGLIALPGSDEIAPFAISDANEVRMRSGQDFATGFPCPVRLFWGHDEPGVADDNRGTLERSRAAGLDVAGIEVPGDHHSMVGPAISQAISFFRAH